jgi:ribulose-phosphate 3-epimerase
MVAPSLLACDFSRLADEIRLVEAAGADWLHVDVMDGHFVPNLTIGPVVVEAIRRVSRLPLDVHLMLDEPQRYLGPFLDAGAHVLTVHIEAPGLKDRRTMARALTTIRRRGARAGLSLRPRTAPARLKPWVSFVDLILVMSVEPGFGGQAFIPTAVRKIRALRTWFTGDIAVDGGINAQTARRCRAAGANVLVAGTFVFGGRSYHDAIRSLRT